jgi:hypothetical protein
MSHWHLPRRKKKLAVCVDNGGYEASLTVGKKYAVKPDAELEKDGMIRVIDEEGEDYIYEARHFRIQG